MPETHLTIRWTDAGREPRCPPNPRFPQGMSIDLCAPGTPPSHACTVALPYPAKRCGAYLIHCTLCGQRVGVTTAGRPDDPRTLRLPCKLRRTPHA